MIAVIFEVEPEEEKRSRYLDLAASLRAELDTFEGSSQWSGFKACRMKTGYCRFPFSKTKQLWNAAEACICIARHRAKDA